MTPPNIETPEGRSQLARQALQEYAEHLRRQSRSRPYAGPDNAEARMNLRAWADAANLLADGLRSGEYTLDDTFAGGEA